ncbi:MAG: GNAT family N-acetyltransferase [Hyphomicrobiales bacterium]|nr:GNAT family N-acetyltransferase [Hyphomicrobiales bacterium]MCP5372661.1 GNAT family N-acetyltransferase [Hyphomicrobiales bacterium]
MTATPAPTLRPARESDVAAIAAVLDRTFPVAYAGVLPPAALAACRAADRLRRLAATGWPHMWVAESGAAVVGFVQVLDARIANLWVAPAAQGTGVGRRLLDLAETAIRRAGHGQARLEVFDGNDRALEFYRSRGWSAVGRGTFDLEGHPIPETVMVKDLGAD